MIFYIETIPTFFKLFSSKQKKKHIFEIPKNVKITKLSFFHFLFRFHFFKYFFRFDVSFRKMFFDLPLGKKLSIVSVQKNMIFRFRFLERFLHSRACFE